MVGLQTLHSTLQTRPKAVCANKANLGMPGRGRTGRCVVRILQARKTNPIPAGRDTPEAPGKSVGIGGTVR